MDSATVAECNLSLLKNEKHCDVAFIVGKSAERINCHQLLLMSRSPVFEVMFAERWKSGQKCKVQIPDVEPSVFRKFLEFIYGDMFTTRINEAIQILAVAHKYEVTRLVEKCELLMKTEIKLQDAIQIYQTARFFDLHLLEEQAGDLMAKGFSKLINDSSFKLMDKDTLISLLSRDDLAVDELQLFLALLRWSRIQLNTESLSVSDQRRVLKPILCCVRFPLMKTQDFAMKVIPTNILSPEESVALFTYMNSELSARVTLRGSLGFPWKPRSLVGTECSVDFYEKTQLLFNFHASYFVPSPNQIDTIQFSVNEANHPRQGRPHLNRLVGAGYTSKTASSKTASIKSLVLRGPNYVPLRNQVQAGWAATTRWIVTLKLLEYRPDTRTADSTSSVEKQNIELFGDRDTEVMLETPFPLVTGTTYRISVSYSSQVYLPLPNYVSSGNIMENDYISSTRLKTTSTTNDKDGNPEFNFGLTSENDYDNTAYNYNYTVYGGYGSSVCSHSIRSMKLNVITA